MNATGFRFSILSVIFFLLLVPLATQALEVGVGDPVGTAAPSGSPSSSGLPSASANPESCNMLFGLPKGTIRGALDTKVMNPEVCDAYLFLMSRYIPGNCSQQVPNAKTNGITSLNPDFAVALAKMLRAMPFPITINSAYRDKNAQNCANPSAPSSNHTFGCAIDLTYPKDHCNSTACQWTRMNSGTFGLRIRMPFAPEWNHIEPTDFKQCRARGPGGGVVPNRYSPTSNLSNTFRNYINPPPQPPQITPYQPPSSSQQPSGSTSQTPPPLGTQNTTPYTSGTCAPQFYCQGSSLFYRSSTCVDQVSEVCQGGCSGTSCVGSSRSVSNVLDEALSRATSTRPTTTPSTKPEDEEEPERKLSAFEQIMLLLDAAPVGVSSEPEPFDVNVSGDEARRLEDASQRGSTSTFLGGGFGYISPGSQQTFQSGEMQAYTDPRERHAAQTTLEIMRQVLLNVLAYLRPFGRPYTQGYE